MFLGLYVYFKMHSLTYAGLATFGGIFLIQVVRFTIIGFKNKKLIQSGINEVDQMDGFQFEEYLALLFKMSGYNAKITKSRGDFGADLILVKDNVKTVVQAKRYSSNVGIKAIQEVVGAVQHYKADKSMVITNSYFTNPAIELAKTNNVELINRDQLVKMLLEVRPGDSRKKQKNLPPEKIANSNREKIDIPVCPRCEKEMVIRKSRQGNEFFGCSNFPSCRQTMGIRYEQNKSFMAAPDVHSK
ncbi:restriction endonuclease [Bacillus sp. FJAT-49711]|uniref:restriction endonuclease n=1 Tax=Bacillus sp. FJAT-49711 TaxID=2833585 RepID=UPI001BCA379D|nr:restriction endonuclease [Bacillus sp. FJAT-49711]MBS4217508.1 restriction endonuclease [Bacillus sp. FJAT-49711]